jgi:hypothetical protein
MDEHWASFEELADGAVRSLKTLRVTSNEIATFLHG